MAELAGCNEAAPRAKSGAAGNNCCDRQNRQNGQNLVDKWPEDGLGGASEPNGSDWMQVAHFDQTAR